MRDIKFRGKRTHDGKWTYGWLVKESDGTAWISKRYHKGEWEQVHPETVGQFTGLEADDIRDHPDSHSVYQDIYEDDIVLIVDIGEQGTSRVTFDDGMFCVDYLENKEPLCNFTEEMRVFVIGNVHDNPELNSELLAQE